MEPGDYFEDLRDNIDAVIYPEDRDGLFNVLNRDAIRKALSETDRFEYFYRLLVGDTPLWFKIRIVYKDIDKKNVIIGCFNAQVEVAEKEKAEQLRRQLIDQMAGDDGVFLIDCANDIRETIHDRVHRAVDFEGNRYSVTSNHYIEKYVLEEDRRKLTEAMSVDYMLERLKTENEYTIQYRDTSFDTPRFFEMKVVKLSDTEVLQSFRDCHDEIQAKRLSDRLLAEYVSIYVVSLKDNTWKFYKREAEMNARYPVTEDYITSLGRYIAEMVHPDDRDAISLLINPEMLKKRFEEQKNFSITFREVSDGAIRYCHCDVISSNDKSHVAFAFKDITEEIEEQNRRTKEAEKTSKLISSIAASYNAAYLVNMNDDSFKQLRLDDDIPRGEYKNFTDAKVFFLGNICHPADREKMAREFEYSVIRENLSKKNSYDTECRVVIGGHTVWYVINVTKIDADDIAVGLLQKDLELIKLHLEEKRYDEYFALFVADIDRGVMKVVKNTQWFQEAKVGESVPYSEMILKLAQHFSDEQKAFFLRLADLDYIKKALSQGDKRSFIYQSPNVHNKWIDVTSYVTVRHEDGVPAEFSIGFSFADEMSADRQEMNRQIAEQKASLEESLTFTNFFLDTYVSAYYVNLDTLTCKVYKRTDILEKEFPIITNYYDSLKDYIDKAVHPEDRYGLLEIVAPDKMRELLGKQIEYTHIFRDISEGRERTYRMQVIRGGEKNHAAFGFLDITDEINEQNKRLKEAEETRKLVENIAAEYNMAWKVNMKDDSFKILRMDDDVQGSKETFNNFSEAKSFFINQVLHPADKERMAQELDYDNIRERLSKRRSFDVEYRALINGTTIWHEMNVTSIAGDDIAVGFVKKDLEIVKRRLEEKRFGEYLALYVVDLDMETIKPFRTSDDPRTIEDAPATPFAGKMKEFISRFEGDAKVFFEEISDLNYMREQFAKDDKRSFAYKTPAGKWVDFICHVIDRHPDGTPSMCAFGLSDSDAFSSERNEMQKQIEEDQNRLQENMEMISGLANEYHALYYVNIKEGYFKVYSIDEKRFPEAKHMVSEANGIVDTFRAFGASPLVHPEDRNVFMNLSTEIILEKLSHSKKFSRRFRRRFGDEFLWTEMEFIKYEDVDEPANIIAVGFAERDAEIRREQEQRQELEDAYNMAQTASNAKSSFLFNMSHDIRTPMNAITGFTAMAKKYVKDPDVVTDYLNKIDLAGQQLLMLINQVLEMARIESGKIEFNEIPVNIKDRFDAMVTILSEQAGTHGLEFHAEMQDIKHFNIIADDARMGQVTLNITGNAMKYTPEGGRIDFTIKEIPARKEGYGTYVFTVADTGIGMSEEFMKDLFEPFARENSSTVSKIQGTGLGLSIVKSLVDLAGGKIDVKSEPGKGTRFDVTMDFKIDDQVQDVEEPAADISAFDFKGKRILLVEDNEMNREIAKFILEDKGMIVEDADDGDVAVKMMEELAKEHSFRYYDFILMDVQMPRMNGYEATGKIREIYDHLGIHIPIIALSANAFEEDRQKSREAGMDDHIAKPIEIDKLRETLARLSR